MKLNQNQADALRWIYEGKKVDAVGEFTADVCQATTSNISGLLKGRYTFRLAPETISPTMPNPFNVDSRGDVTLIAMFHSVADRDAALAAIRKEME